MGRWRSGSPDEGLATVLRTWGLVKGAAPSSVTTVATAQSAEFSIADGPGEFRSSRTCSSRYAG